MRSELEKMGHGCYRVISGCVVARFGDWYYSAGDTCNVLTNTPRTLFSMIEFIEAHDDKGQYVGTRGFDA